MKINEIFGGQVPRKKIVGKDRSDAIEQLIKEFGFKYPQSGGRGTVISHSNLPYVVKIFDKRDKGYIEFIKLALQHRDNPHFPKFRGKLVEFDKFYAVRMEKLYILSLQQWHTDISPIVRAVESDSKHWQNDIQEGTPEYAYMQTYPLFGPALLIVKEARLKTMGIVDDIYEKNIMQKYDGTPVITDPWLFMPPSTTRFISTP